MSAHNQDIPSLRLSCRTIAVAIDYDSVPQFFSKRMHLFTLQGVLSLTDIPEVSRLAAKSQQLKLVPVKLSEDFARVEDYSNVFGVEDDIVFGVLAARTLPAYPRYVTPAKVVWVW